MVVLVVVACSWPIHMMMECVNLRLAVVLVFTTLLALTGLLMPLCVLINGLNRPPALDLKRGLCVKGGGGGHMSVHLDCH